MIDKLCQYSTLPVLILDASGRAVKVNPAFQLYWNADPQKLLGPAGYSVFEDDLLCRRGMAERLREALLGFPVQFEPSDYRLPLKYCRKGAAVSKPRDLSIFAVPLPDPQGAHTLALIYYDEAAGANLNILERRCDQLTSLAESVVEMKHEINNPLLLIIGHAQLMMAKSDKLPAEVVRKLEKILGAAEKIRVTVQHHTEMCGSLLEGEEKELME
jgi:nitrogen-specific signal transduction histidine kinase